MAPPLRACSVATVLQPVAVSEYSLRATTAGRELNRTWRQMNASTKGGMDTESESGKECARDRDRDRETEREAAA